MGQDRHTMRTTESDIPDEHLDSFCRGKNGTCMMIDFRTDDNGTRVITCSKGSEVKHPSDLNRGEQFIHCSGPPSHKPTVVDLSWTRRGIGA